MNVIEPQYVGSENFFGKNMREEGTYRKKNEREERIFLLKKRKGRGN